MPSASCDNAALKIVYTLPAYRLCGGVVHHAQVIRRLAQRGHQVEVFAPVVEDLDLLPKIPEEVKIHRHRHIHTNLYSLPSERQPWKFLRAFWDLTCGLRGIARELPADADIVYAGFYPNAFAGDLMRKQKHSRAKVLLAMHDDPDVFLRTSYRRYQRIWSGAPNHADALLTVSDALEKKLEEKYQKPVFKVGNGVDEDLLSKPKQDFQPVEELLQLEGKPYLLYVGGINYHKGIDLLIESYSRIRESHPELMLALVGKCAYPPFLSDLTRRFGVQNSVRHIPGVGREILPALYDHAAAFVFPSRTEGFGLPPLEAMARGCPVVCTTCMGIAEYARDGENCLQVSTNDSGALARVMERVLKDKALTETLRRAGRETAVQFTWDRVADRTEQAIRSVLATPDAVNGKVKTCLFR